MEETAAIAEFVTSLSYSSLPEDVRRKGCESVRDTLSVALYAAPQPFGQRILNHVEAMSPGQSATIYGLGSASVAGAAFANGALAHANDYDDTFESVVIHPSATSFPAALSVTEEVAASGRALLTGYIAGLETTFRIGHATYPGHYTHGFHGTGTVGSFGATAAAASILELSKQECQRAFGIVASCASALLRNAGTATKAIHAGHAARVGVEAALLAKEGITADETILSGERGYGNVVTPDGTYNPDSIRSATREWGTLDIGIKPYPCGRITHAAIEGMRELVVREGLVPEEVDRIVVTLDEAAADLMTYQRPTTPEEARASVEIGLAATLREGIAGPDEYTTEYIKDERTREQMEKIKRQYEPNLFGRGFANYGAKLVVTTVDGTEFEIERAEAPGGPSNPLSESRLREKFIRCATSAVSEATANDLYEAAGAIDKSDNLSRILAAVRPT